MKIQELEMKMWNAAKNRDSQAFLEVVDEKAVMVCGGFRCTGADYVEIIKEFDVAQYKISNFEVIEKTESLCQIHYVIELAVADRKNVDLEGVFHITSTWKKVSDEWKLVFNMDSRIITL
nr:nuclear transport factor 2 family protein [Lachnospiraceae bacterium]